MAIELNIRKPLQAKIGRLDLDTARSLVVAAEKASACARGWVQLLQSRLTSEKPLDEEALSMAADMAVELATASGKTAQLGLALHHIFTGDEGRC